MRAAMGLGVLAMLIGCAPSVDPPDKPAQPQAVHSSNSHAAVKITKGEKGVLEDLAAAHKGQVVFVDYWATWCLPCVESFPHTVELSRKYKERGLATIAVSFDDPAEEAAVRDFLVKLGADFENLISTYDLGPAAFEGFGLDQVPHFRLYDRQGKLRHKWDEHPVDAAAKIEELLAEAGN